jgi:hypothetical protein
MIDLECPTCLKQFRVPVELAGKKGICPKCKTRINIPTANAEPIEEISSVNDLDSEKDKLASVMVSSAEAVSQAQPAVCQAVNAKRRSGLKIILGTIVALGIGSGLTYWANYANLQSEMDRVIQGDNRNSGVQVSVHYGNYVDSSILIYDLEGISSNSMADVFRVFLQFASAIKNKRFTTVELAFKEQTKFKLDGAYFQKLGEEYSYQNPIYTMRTFPENLLNSDGSRAYSQWEGGWLGVTEKQMEDFTDFHKKWYLNDL